MTKHNPITNIDLTLKEIYDEYVKSSIYHLWESREDETQSLNTLTDDLRKDLYGILNKSFRRQTLRRMFSEGYTMMMVPSKKFNLLDDAATGLRDFTVSVFDENCKLILVLTTDEVSW